jgi:hypothetical protein
MRNVYIKKTIRIRLTANDWSLYGDDDDPKRDMAAYEMNEKIEAVLNEHPTREEATIAISTILNQYSDFGAYDSEGVEVAGDLIREFFN